MTQANDLTKPPERRSAGVIAGLRQPLPWPTDRPFRILSIDGGGIKGIFPASVLTAFERELCGGASAGRYFDLIAGTSTGGIIALGLGLGMPASRILELYMANGEAIFPPVTGPFRRLKRAWLSTRRLLRYSYEREPLEVALETVFGDRLLGESERRLCIPSFEGNYGEVQVFKTPHHPDFRLDWREKVVDVALATAAAPSFFKVFRNQGRVFADGGVWANNPIMIGLVDALSTTDVARRNIHILSISCGDLDVPFSGGQLGAGGLIHWREIIKSAMHLASQNATGQAGLLIGRDQVIRLEPSADGARLEMDDVLSAKTLLPSLGETVASQSLEKVRHLFETEADLSPAYHGPRGADPAYRV